MFRRNLTSRRILRAAASVGLVAACSLSAACTADAATETTVSIRGTSFLVNGRVTYSGTSVEGLLLNSRMANALFDDENPNTVSNWRYPDTGRWDPERNTDEFVAALPSYAAKGLNAVTISLQGGNPMPTSGTKTNQTWIVSAFRQDGSLKPAWMSRLRRVLAAADANGIVVILALYYQAQEQRLSDEAAVKRGVDNVVDWLLAQPHRNVLVEVVNESNHAYIDHAILKPSRVAELISRVGTRSGGRLLASTSFTGSAYVPPASVIRAADYVLIHGNSLDPAGLRAYVDKVRATDAFKANPKPIVVNEDSTSLSDFGAAVSKRVSWGYHDKGRNNYRDGFQCPPVNWRINTSEKRAFFERVRTLAEAAAPPDPPPPPPPPSPEPPPPPAGDLEVGSRGLGESLSGSVRWEAVVAGGTPERVEFLIDGKLRWTERSAPYVYGGNDGTLDTRTLTDGEHTFTVRASASDGRTATKTTRVTVQNEGAPEPPGDPEPDPDPDTGGESFTVRIEGPVDGQVVSGELRWEAVPAGADVRKVEFLVDGDLRWTERNAPYVFGGSDRSWNSALETNGVHVLTTRAVSTSGQVARTRVRLAVIEGIGGFSSRPRLGAGASAAVVAQAPAGTGVTLTVRGPRGGVLGRARMRATENGTVRERVRLRRWRGQRPLRAVLVMRFAGHLRRAGSELSLPAARFVGRPRVARGQTLRVRASAVPRSAILVTVRDQRGRVLGVARTRAGRRGVVFTRVAMPLWRGERRLRVEVTTRYTSGGERRRRTASRALTLSRSELRLAGG